MATGFFLPRYLVKLFLLCFHFSTGLVGQADAGYSTRSVPFRADSQSRASPSYVVKVKNKVRSVTAKPDVEVVVNDEPEFPNGGVLMTGPNGKKYRCFLPSSDALVDENALRLKKDTAMEMAAKEDASVEMYRALLKESKMACVSTRIGYWSYEVCPFVGARQFHKKIGKKKSDPDGPTYHVGDYQADRDELAEGGEGGYVQHFLNGFEGRKASILFKCDAAAEEDGGTDSSATKGAAKLIVEEPSERVYRFTYSTPHVCYSKVKKRPETLAEQANTVLLSLHKVCIRYVESWWTYELCGGNKVRQFHVNTPKKKDESESAVDTTEYVLGNFDSEFNAQMVDGGDAILPSPPLQRYIEVYNAGTRCDLTKKFRRVTVEYMCSDSEKTFISSVEEVSTCNYKMTVLTPLLCSLKGFDKETKKNANLEDITCFEENQLSTEI